MKLLKKTVFFMSIFAMRLIYLLFSQKRQIYLASKNYSLCAQTTPKDYVSSYGILNSKVAIIIIVSNYKHFEDYQIAIETVKCYAKHWGYQMHIINLEHSELSKFCLQTDVFFQRHCVLALYMKAQKEAIEYVLYIDADMGVINPCHTIQEYIPEKDTVEISFYERYFNHEFAAGSYLIKNTDNSRKFLMFWANYFFRLPQSFHGTDNGALHQVLMELHFTERESQMQCFNLWNKSRNYDDLFIFEACTKHALLTNSTFLLNNTVNIIQKLTPGWVRDGWLTDTKWGPQDFMFHGWKKSKLESEWNWPFNNKYVNTNCMHMDLSFPNFKYNFDFISKYNEIQTILKNRTELVNAEYIKYLKTLKLL